MKFSATLNRYMASTYGRNLALSLLILLQFIFFRKHLCNSCRNSAFLVG